MARPRIIFSEYRNYELPADFPILALHGDNWLISPVQSPRLHFHNCVEIGICRRGSGEMIIGEDQVCRVIPKTGYTIAQASSDAGEIVRNQDGSVSLLNVGADTVLALKVLPQPADGTENCA